MKISYNWLKQYIDIDIEVKKLAEILTDIGLEVGGIEKFQSIKGGLEGLVVGEVKSCVAHPDSDHLSLTSVDLGDGVETPIVCGAPNVAAGQKVIVATVGTTLYDGDEQFKIKKSKIRGQVSMGMICAEDEIGVGKSHDGIMVLPNDLTPGMPAKDYFKIEDDTIIEIDLTPNRVDGASHIGVARDICAYLKQEREITYQFPSVDDFKIDNTNLQIPVEVENTEACPRYSGVTLTDVTVAESPEWLQNRLKAIGLNPINNVVDVTNFVLHEVGQPLHAFDADEIAGQKVVVKTLPQETAFVTLDNEQRKLHADDLMICNTESGMCIAGVFGGAKSGVTEKTTKIFLESAYFNPVWVRKTARRHGLNTDASFRFERGVDPNLTIYALKRAANLICELAGAKVSSDIVDVYPNPIAHFAVDLRFAQVKRLIGEELPTDKIKNILTALEIEIVGETEEKLSLKVPPYRVDVQREADVIEEILRIYGYNTVPIYDQVNSTLAYAPKPDPNVLKELIANQLSGSGLNEMMSNSLTKAEYYAKLETLKSENLVQIFNPLSQDLNAMRQTLLFGALEAVAFNGNRQNADLKMFEFGNCYHYQAEKTTENPVKRYTQSEKLALVVSGNRSKESWITKTEPVSFYFLKSVVERVFTQLGVAINRAKVTHTSTELYSDMLLYEFNNQPIGFIAVVHRKVRKAFDIKPEVYFAELNWENLMNIAAKHKVEYTEIPKFPEVRRDLSLLLDNKVTFAQLKDEAMQQERKLLKDVSLFDVYEGKNLGDGKKSYALSFILQDESKTLKDKQIDKIMNKFIQRFDQQFGAKIR